jgi:hypothetical protein
MVPALLRTIFALDTQGPSVIARNLQSWVPALVLRTRPA